MKNSRAGLRHAFALHERATFPIDRGASEELSEAHADLAEYDGHVAGLVASVLGCVTIDRSLLEPDADLRGRLQRLADDSNDTIAVDAKEHLAYCDELNELLILAREVVGT